MPSPKVPAYRRKPYQRKAAKPLPQKNGKVSQEQLASENDVYIARQRKAKAGLEELKLARAEGELLPTADVERVLAQALTGVKTRLMAFTHKAVLLLEPDASHIRHREMVAMLDPLMAETLAGLLPLTKGISKEVALENLSLKDFHAQQEKMLEEARKKVRQGCK
jgi:hypothetical protein